MILIADSGATKTEWRMIENTKSILEIISSGINPHYQSSEQIVEILEETIEKGRLKRKLNEIYFYGAGISSIEKVDQVKSALEYAFIGSSIEVHTDILGVARALCGRGEGMISILGTGSAACQFNGRNITHQVPSLGFILGDEGSGAHLGKLLVAAYLRGELNTEINNAFHAQFHLNKEDILKELNTGKTPSRFLGGFAPFLSKHLEDPGIYQLVYSSIKEFIQKYILPLPGAKTLQLHFCGGTAYHFSTVLRAVCNEQQIALGSIVKSPMEGLTKYHMAAI